MKALSYKQIVFSLMKCQVVTISDKLAHKTEDIAGGVQEEDPHLSH